MQKMGSRITTVLVLGAILSISAPVSAQAWHYAAFQPADVVAPEANFIISGFGDYGTSFVGQYRWMVEKRTQLWADVGVANPSGATYFLVGIAGGWNFMKPTPDKPIDVTGTVGLYGAFGNNNNASFIRIPLGVDVGHTWMLSNGHSLQAFGYPRVSIDICTSDCGGIGTNTNLEFDLGAGYEITKAMAGRAAFTFGAVGNGDGQVGFGVSLAVKTN
jgi:hypothetical protein